MSNERQTLFVLKKSACHLKLKSWDGKTGYANVAFLL